MFIVEDLHFESDVQEAIETLPQELPSLYLPPLHVLTYDLAYITQVMGGFWIVSVAMRNQ